MSTTSTVSGSESTAEAPLLRVVNPDATPEEVAAIVAVLSSLGGAAPSSKPRPRSAWSSPAHRLGLRTAGPGAWRASALPR